VSREATNSKHVRPKRVCLLDPAVMQACEAHHRPVNVSHNVAGPILNAVAVLRVLRQVFGTWQKEDVWQRPMRYEVSPDDCLSLTTYSLDELERALEALGEVETLVKAYERGDRTQSSGPRRDGLGPNGAGLPPHAPGRGPRRGGGEPCTPDHISRRAVINVPDHRLGAGIPSGRRFGVRSMHGPRSAGHLEGQGDLTLRRMPSSTAS
jgi:hypothetical protein